MMSREERHNLGRAFDGRVNEEEKRAYISAYENGEKVKRRDSHLLAKALEKDGRHGKRERRLLDLLQQERKRKEGSGRRSF